MCGETSFGTGRARALKNLLTRHTIHSWPYCGLGVYVTYTPKPHSATILHRHTLLAARFISRASVIQVHVHVPSSAAMYIYMYFSPSFLSTFTFSPVPLFPLSTHLPLSSSPTSLFPLLTTPLHLSPIHLSLTPPSTLTYHLSPILPTSSLPPLSHPNLSHSLQEILTRHLPIGQVSLLTMNSSIS